MRFSHIPILEESEDDCGKDNHDVLVPRASRYSVYAQGSYFTQMCNTVAGEYANLLHEWVTFKEFFNNPYSNKEMLSQFIKKLHHPDKSFELRSTVYLYVIKKDDVSVRLKVGCTREPTVRMQHLKYGLGECAEIHLFDVAAGFEIELFLKHLLKKYNGGNDCYKTEVFDIPVQEYSDLLVTLGGYTTESKHVLYGQ